MICDPKLRTTSDLAKVPMMQHGRNVAYFEAVEGTKCVAFLVDIFVDNPPSIFEVDERRCSKFIRIEGDPIRFQRKTTRIEGETIHIEGDIPARPTSGNPWGTEVGLSNQELSLLLRTLRGELVLHRETPPS